MKKLLLPVSLFLVMGLGLSSCEGLLDDCMICSLNTYEDGVLTLKQNEAEYCGTELTSVLAQPRETIGNTSIYWECH